MNETAKIELIVQALTEQYKTFTAPDLINSFEGKRDPFRTLISCLLSLRTKDETTYPAAERLYKLADNPYDMLKLRPELIEEAIYPVGFYRNKTETILLVCKTLVEEYSGKVPATMEQLLAMKGVGRKTANLVLAKGFGIPAICVDTHVHRISNRLGYVRTKDPLETEMALREKLPQHLWMQINTVLVRHGQNICKPITPLCDRCPVEQYCAKVDVNAVKKSAKKKKG